jgi:hypothetical protein
MRGRGRGDVLFWGLLVVFVLSLKLVIFGIDHIPRVFFGDSGYYLFTSYTRNVPDDRSFTYGRLIALFSGSSRIQGLLTAQLVASAISAVLAAVTLRVGFDASRVIVAAAAVLASLAPLQLAYERFILTECFATLCFALIVTAAVWYLRKPNVWLLAVIAALGVGFFSLRLNAIPLTWATIIILPLLAWRSHLNVWRHLAFGLTVTLAFHTMYRRHYGSLRQGPSAYYYGGGTLLLALVSPIVTAADFPNRELSQRVLSETRIPLASRPLSLRDYQMWSPEGLIAAFRRNSPDQNVVAYNAAAQTVALHAIRRDPVGAVMLGASTVGSYLDPTLTWSFEPGAMREVVAKELAVEAMPDAEEIRRYSLTPQSLGPSVTRWWHSTMFPWYSLLMFCPGVALAGTILASGRQRTAAMFVAFESVFVIMTGPFLALTTIVRYLHPLEWLMVVAAGVVVQSIRCRRIGRLPGS